MRYLSQMPGLANQNFVSAATGMAVSARGPWLCRAYTPTIGNFWVDLMRSTLYMLLPLSFVGGPVARLPGRHPELQAL